MAYPTPVKTRVDVLRQLFRVVDSDWNGGIRELSRVTGLSYEAMRRWKLGEASPSLDRLQDICDVLGYEIVIRQKNA